ncbi:MAG: GNAT family N-acetyltransferase [Gammaproteobacteria bacterium]|nr:GNAT family N-acetyltransferase [Gammaproteobacteria bacterium]NND38813.1 N-acetyltransferase [Pseudomonadales bacterium]MBT8151554.1 GNAT family N-acetyltransferase [Gammaproteobacteria bacterium]NNL10140.1 N-acetyltransferase [Pseudomonadales bacterium]NNM10419.1 N-acetyltransferase [Pseudomonadales bacterium]
MKLRLVQRISDIGEQTWRSCAGDDYPFLRYEFLHALENAGGKDTACSAASGWIPQHLVVSSGGRDVAVMPMYLKDHSYGEYIFDWSWAEAYHRNGLDYYPKLLAAIPFTPATGPRLAIDAQYFGDQYSNEKANLMRWLAEQVPALCLAQNASSFHLLFPDEPTATALAQHNLLLRHSFQYHWFNQNEHGECFSGFDDYAGALKARKRKALSRERRDVQQQEFEIKRLTGEQISAEVWEDFYSFYQITYAKRSGHGGYLPKAFFLDIGARMAEQILLVAAYKNGKLIAAALNFFSSSTLFGRYWGCTEAAEFLHFELCYYQGIEFCIERGLEKFDAGAQGEHKIQRGFRPVDTWSVHWIAREDFRRAIANYLQQERSYNRQHMQAAMQLLPFRNAG